MNKHNGTVCLQGKVGNVLVMFLVWIFGGWQVMAAPKDSPWGKDYFPNVVLTDQDGKEFKFYDDLIKDKVVAINFIYTNCGDTCPLETANLKRVYALLSERMGKDIFFYSISIDPKNDSVKSLKEYSERFKVGEGWSFLAGKKEDIVQLQKKLGLYNSEGEKKLSSHNTNFIIGNESTGQWNKKTPYDEPMTLARALGYSLSKVKIVPGGQHIKYSEAKEITDFSKTEELYKSRCMSCHSLGSENNLGPGLQGVMQRREKVWLARWLKEPDRMLSEKDPIAIDLYNRYNKIIMPNLRLDDSQIEAMLGYLQSATNIGGHAH